MSLKLLATIVAVVLPVLAFAEPMKLGCYFDPIETQPIESAQLEISKFWNSERDGLFLVYDPATFKTTLDSDIESTATFAKIIPNQLTLLGDEYIQVTIDMLWVKGVRKKYDSAQVVIGIDRYSLVATMTLTMTEKGERPPPNGYWQRRGLCHIRKF